VFTARYGQHPYTAQILFVFKGENFVHQTKPAYWPQKPTNRFAVIVRQLLWLSCHAGRLNKLLQAKTWNTVCRKVRTVNLSGDISGFNFWEKRHCDAVRCGRWMETFRWHILFLSSGWNNHILDLRYVGIAYQTTRCHVLLEILVSVTRTYVRCLTFVIQIPR
jgi:hypothetical protein